MTIDPDELELEAGNSIEVLEMADRDWWRGRIPASPHSGWFPAAFVKVQSTQIGPENTQKFGYFDAPSPWVEGESILKILRLATKLVALATMAGTQRSRV